MSIDELQAAIERRGYTIRRPDKEPPIKRGQGLWHAGYTTLYIFRKNVYIAFAVSHADLGDVRMSVGEFAELILRGLAKDQHHVWCSQCHEPLLHKEIYVRGAALDYGVPLEQINRDRMEQQYRSAKAGPDSPILSNCPKCGALLSNVNTSEIMD